MIVASASSSRHVSNVNKAIFLESSKPSSYCATYIVYTFYRIGSLAMSFGGAPRCTTCGSAVYHAEQVMGPARKVRLNFPCHTLHSSYPFFLDLTHD